MCTTTMLAQRQTNFLSRLWRSAPRLMMLLGAVLLPITAAKAQSVLSQGDAVVTGFSGIKPLDASVPPSTNPLDTFFIDLDGPSMQIVQLRAAGAPPQGQLITAPVPFKVKAGDIGQVFAIALDDATPPNIYLGATSAFGIQIVLPGPDGRPRRVKTGQASADWMPGQFGSGIGGRPGSIYKVDGRTGAVTLFADIPNNSGPGLGDIVHDRRSRHFYVSDLDTGLIHRLSASGTIIDSFDHGVAGRPAHGLPPVADAGVAMNIRSSAFNAEDPSTWGYTGDDRLVWGLAIRGGRLYYAAGPQVWSVGLKVDGGFADDARWELDVAGMENGSIISDMAFDAEGRLYLAQRGRVRGSYDYTVFAEAKQSAVLRYQRDPATPDAWVRVPDEYAIGMPRDHRNASGGVALGYGHNANGTIRRGTCDAMLWSTGDSLRSSTTQISQTVSARLPNVADVHGLQGNSRDLVRPQNTPPVTSYFIDYDGEFADPEKAGHVGDVEIWQPCEDQANLQPLPGGSGLPLPASPPSDRCLGDQCSLPQCEPGMDCCRDGRCPPRPERTNLSIDKTAFSCSKIAGGQRCGFLITVTNTGPGQYNDPILVQDVVPAGTSAIFSSPHWTCAGGPPVFACATLGAVTLNPGQSAAPIPVRVNVSDSLVKPLNCKVKNEVQIVGPPGGSDGNTNPADDKASATANIAAELCQDPPQGEKINLKIFKGSRSQTCKVNGAGWRCFFQVIVTNTGPGVYSGSIQFKDMGSIPNALVAPIGGDFNCGGSPADMTCTTKQSVVLAPNQSVQEEFVWQVDVSDVQPGVCALHNEAKITAAPGGSPQNIDPADDQASATVQFPKLIVGDVVYCGKPSTVTTNLKLEKKAVGCSNNGPIWCNFVITVTNTGPGVYNDKFAVEDLLPAGFDAQQAQFSWPICLKTANKATCLHGSVTLNPGDSVSLSVQVPVPRLFKACELKNEARILPVPGGAEANTNLNDDHDTATVKIPMPGCGGTVIDPGINPHPVSEPPSKCPSGWEWTGERCRKRVIDFLPPPPPSSDCRPGMVSSRGHCCPVDSVWTGRICAKQDQPKHCPVGTTGRYPDCKCPTGQTGTPPNCKRDIAKHCPAGTTQRGNLCIKKNEQKQLKTEPPRKLTTPPRFNSVPPRMAMPVPSNQRVRR
jgi:uncharacterized repeat protein (TIGR01451 family)